MSDYFDPTCGGEPYYLKKDQGYGTCYECGSGLTSEGAMSDGDGDFYDALYCPLCQEMRGKANLIWIDSEGTVFDDEDEFHALGVFDDDGGNPEPDDFTNSIHFEGDDEGYPGEYRR